MIKIETHYDNDTDNFSCECHTRETHTLEHLSLIAYIWNKINQNDKEISDIQIFAEVIDIKNQIRNREEE